MELVDRLSSQQKYFAEFEVLSSILYKDDLNNFVCLQI
jgi:hypothetical protein